MTRSAEHTAARRAVARAHHPDVGGDADVYAAELAAVERRFATTPETGPVRFRASPWKRRRRTLLRALTRSRTKRYFDI